VKWARGLLASFVAGAGIVAPAAALANEADNARAQALFDEALAQMKAGRFADACPKLQQSLQVDPTMGTKYQLARCYEGAGRIGKAWNLLVEVAADARYAQRPDLETQANERAVALKPRLPLMTIVVPAVAQVPGLIVTRDDQPVQAVEWGRPAPVDPGEHQLAATAPGKKTWRQTVRSTEGASLEVAVPALEADIESSEKAGAAKPDTLPLGPRPITDAPRSSATAGSAEPATGGMSGQRIAGIATGAVGVAGMIAGGVLGGLAKSKWDTALLGCKGGDTTKCSPAAIADGKTASTLATGSTVGFVAGGAALAAGVIVLLTAPSQRAHASGWEVVPAIGLGGSGGVVRGRF
jgi:hypothetical protein